MSNDKDFVPYSIALELKQLGFDEPCFGCYDEKGVFGLTVMSIKQYYINIKEDTWNCSAPLYQQAINFLYICSDKQIDIELKGSDTHEERIRKIEQGCKDLWNLQNNKSK
jgi:hypothetical protein